MVVPEPSPDPLRFFKKGGKLVVALRDGAFTPVLWEDLLKDNLALDSLLASHPCSIVASWVRTARTFAVPTVTVMRDSFPELDAKAVLSWWGPALTPDVARLVLGITTATLDKMGLTADMALELGWRDERWNTLFKSVPVVTENRASTSILRI